MPADAAESGAHPFDDDDDDDDDANELDEECLQRFIKVACKYITDGEVRRRLLPAPPSPRRAASRLRLQRIRPLSCSRPLPIAVGWAT